jgi:hypothetical protein
MKFAKGAAVGYILSVIAASVITAVLGSHMRLTLWVAVAACPSVFFSTLYGGIFGGRLLSALQIGRRWFPGSGLAVATFLIGSYAGGSWQFWRACPRPTGDEEPISNATNGLVQDLLTGPTALAICLAALMDGYFWMIRRGIAPKWPARVASGTLLGVAGVLFLIGAHHLLWAMDHEIKINVLYRRDIFIVP